MFAGDCRCLLERIVVCDQVPFLSAVDQILAFLSAVGGFIVIFHTIRVPLNHFGGSFRPWFVFFGLSTRGW